MQLFRQPADLGQRLFLCAQLDQVRAPANQFRRDVFGFCHLDVTEIEDRVETAALERIHHARAQSCSRLFDGLSSNVSEFISRSTKPVS